MKKTILMVVTIFCVGLLTACNVYETDKANKFVDEANKAILEANEKLGNGNTKLVEMENSVPQIESEEELEKVRAVAKEAIPLLETARDRYKEAGGKFEDASKLKLQDKFKEYLDNKAKEMKKRGEVVDLMLGEPQALLKSDSKEEYQKLVDDLVVKIKALRTEADDFASKADKIMEANKDIFKSAN